ncbi:MAG: hypothetical protein EHM93_19990 [Bacteroidales bacterium]|nr:MAG: hypothetical protein EHM93_19990 [Bacteroidales bacterium]
MRAVDIQARKLEFIEEYIRLSDERIINKLEKLLRLEKEKTVKPKLKTLTQAELGAMIEESEDDISMGNVMSHQSVKQEVLSWRSDRRR